MPKRSNPRTVDLNVASPEEVPTILYRAAEYYYESASELALAWQDRGAGKPWLMIARILEAAAEKIEKNL
jgi:hypothetical protein